MYKFFMFFFWKWVGGGGGPECNVFAVVTPAVWAIRHSGFLLQYVRTTYRDDPMSYLMDTGSFFPLE
jgi:hypothetical protein